MTVTKEKVVWESARYHLRIVEIRMFNTLELLTHSIEKLEYGQWQHVNSRKTLDEALLYIEYIFGIEVEKEQEWTN